MTDVDCIVLWSPPYNHMKSMMTILLFHIEALSLKVVSNALFKALNQNVKQGIAV